MKGDKEKIRVSFTLSRGLLRELDRRFEENLVFSSRSAFVEFLLRHSLNQGVDKKINTVLGLQPNEEENKNDTTFPTSGESKIEKVSKREDVISSKGELSNKVEESDKMGNKEEKVGVRGDEIREIAEKPEMADEMLQEEEKKKPIVKKIDFSVID